MTTTDSTETAIKTATGGTQAGPLDVTFTAEILKSPAKGGWTYLVWPDSPTYFGTKGRVKVVGTVDGEPVRTSFMALGDGRHKLPVTAAVLTAVGKAPGDTVTVHLTKRL